MIEVSFIAAFFGGVLALLSPCSALLLPAFFAYAFQSKRELSGRTVLFYLGLATVFVPLGMGASLATNLVIDHRDTLILIAGGGLIGFGVLELAGRSLSPLKLSSGVGEETRSVFATYSLGLIYGFGGFCSGPILGSVLTVAATDENAFRGGALLATYALGMVAPLFVLALLWDRLGIGKRRLLRGTGLQLGGFSIHSTNLIAGLVFIILGISFIVLRGSNALSGTYESWGLTEVSFQADRWVRDATSAIPDVGFLAIVAVIVAGAAALRFYHWFANRANADLEPHMKGSSASK